MSKKKTESLNDVKDDDKSFLLKPIIKYGLLLLGMMLVAIAIDYSSFIMLFSGLSLMLWGSILFYVSPNVFIRKELLLSVIPNQYLYYGKMLKENIHTNKFYYYSPKTIWGIKNSIIIITKHDTNISNERLESFDKLSSEDGLVFYPPGQNLSLLMEKSVKIDFSTSNMENLDKNISKSILYLNLADKIETSHLDSQIKVIITNSIFKDFIKDVLNDDIFYKIGDPLVSAILCIYSRVIKKPIMIEKTKVNSNNIIVNLKII